jgi:hypothetical protein
LICDKLEAASKPRIKCICDKLEVGENVNDKRATLICDELEVASKPRILFTADLGGYATKEGEIEDDKWITVTGRGITKSLLKPKIKLPLHKVFAILSQPNDPTSYSMMSGPLLQMDDDKTILPPDPRNVKRYLINYPHLSDYGQTYFVFLFRRGTEQPHQGDMNNSTILHRPCSLSTKINFEDAIRSD